MKLVTQFIDPADAAAAAKRLREAGVMTEVRSLDPHIMQPSRSGASRIGLWVVFDDQLEDAVELMQNPDHVPRRVLSSAEMKALQPLASIARPEPQRGHFDTVVTVVGGLILLGLVVFTAVGFFLEE